MGKISDKLWKTAGEKKIPLTGAFELLPICNLKCKMCYIRKSMDEVNESGGLLPAKFWLDIAKQAGDMGMLFPLLTGGEPFLRHDFQEIYAGIQEMGMQVSINSNGTMIDEAMARWLGKHVPTRINITLYGSSEKSYERLCGNGDAYNRVRKSVELLKKYRIPVKFNTSITPENINDMEDMINYAKSVQSPIQVATYMFPPLRRDNTMFGQNNRLSPEEAGYARVKADWLQNDQEWFKIQAARFERFVPITKSKLEEQSSTEPKGMTCRAGRCSFWVDWQGNIGSCGMYLTSKVSLKENKFENAWKQVVEETNNIRFSSACTNCPNINLCHSCIAMVHNESGSINGIPEYLCKMNEATAKYYKEFAEK